MNVVTEINAQVNSVSLSFLTRKTNSSNANKMERTNNVVGGKAGRTEKIVVC